MSDRLIKMDYGRNKVIVMRAFTNPDGTSYEKQIEMNLPKTQEVEGKLNKINIKDDGTMYETEETIKLPVINIKKEGSQNEQRTGEKIRSADGNSYGCRNCNRQRRVF